MRFIPAYRRDFLGTHANKISNRLRSKPLSVVVQMDIQTAVNKANDS